MATFNTSGASIYYETHGQGDPLVLVHGFPLSARMWEPSIAALSSKWKVIVPETRGLGRSTGAAQASMTQYADDIAALLDHIGEKRPVVLAGMSMGGYTAFEFYRRHAARVRALVLVDTHPKPDTPQKAQDRHALADRVMKEGSKVAADGMMPSLFASAAPAALRDEWSNIMNAAPAEGVAAALRAMAARADSQPTLAAIRVPTLIIVGEHDAITPPDLSRAMQAAIPGSKLEIIPGAGHMLPVEKPKEMTAALTTFLSGL